MRLIRATALNLLTVAAAAAIGFGVPMGWVWVGAQMQGERGATTTSFSVALVILFGIVVSYVILLWLGNLAMARFSPPETNAQSRSPWMRGMTEARPGGQGRMAQIERLFVITALFVSVAFWLWFVFLAGSPFPSQFF